MRKIISLIFIFILVVPTAAWLIGLDFGIKINRAGFEFPRPYGRALFENEYYLSFDQYFNDSFSMRAPLIVAKNWFDLHVFRTADDTKIHVGKDGWLYRRKSVEDYRKEACSDKTDVGWTVLKLRALEKIIEGSGRRFFFIVAPNKVTIYPEYMGFVPESNSCNLSHYDLLLEHLREDPLEGFVRLDQLMREAKNSHSLIFDKDSTHWNRRGARVAAEALHQQIFRSGLNLPQPDSISIDDDQPGDLKLQLLGLAPRSEANPSQLLSGSHQPAFPRALVYGDSSLRNFLPYLAQMFKQLDVIRADRMLDVKPNENLRASDYILIETSESELENLKIDLDGIYALLQAEATIPEKATLDLKAAVPVLQCSLDLKPDGLEIKSLGAQSAFELKSVPASDNTTFKVLKLSMVTPQPDLMKITYQTGSPFVAKKHFKAGLQNFYLPLPYQESISLRFYPGNRAGLFVLRSAEILGFPIRPSMEEPFNEGNTVAKVSIDDENTAKMMSPDSDSSSSQIDAGMPKGSIGAASNDIRPGESSSENADGFASNQTVISAPDSGGAIDIIQSESIAARAKSETKIKVSAEAANQVFSNESIGVNLAGDKKMSRSNEISIAVADFDDGRIFQRKGLSAKIVVSGTFTGMIDSVEARVIKDETSEEVVPWTVIDKSSQNGIFMGTIPNVPQGGWYNLQVRDSKNHSISNRGTSRWGVGMLVACLGQSNMKEWFYTGDFLKAHPLLRKYTASGWAELDDKGNAAIAFGNRLIDRLDIPVGLLDFSINGSGLRNEADWGTGYWEDTAAGSIYRRFVSGVVECGGTLEFVIWIQGEADAARGTVTEQEYSSSLKSFITNQIRSDVENGSQREYLPFLVVMMVKRPGGQDEPHQAIRDAQKYVTENLSECYLAAATLDLKNQGKQHLAPEAYTVMGRRVSQTVLYILGEETYYRGPIVSEVNPLDNRTIDIRIKHNGGSDFTPPSGITGWEILENGNLVPIDKVYRHDANTIRIIIRHPIEDNVEIRYLYGAMPDAVHPVLDNSTMTLPLEEYHFEIQQ